MTRGSFIVEGNLPIVTTKLPGIVPDTRTDVHRSVQNFMCTVHRRDLRLSETKLEGSTPQHNLKTTRAQHLFGVFHTTLFKSQRNRFLPTTTKGKMDHHNLLLVRDRQDQTCIHDGSQRNWKPTATVTTTTS